MVVEMTDDEYQHPDHGEMEWHSVEHERRGIKVEGWRCKRCNVIGPPDRADEVFDSHDCDHYRELTHSITGGINRSVGDDGRND